MVEVLKEIMPNVVVYKDKFFDSILDTVIMTFWSGAFMFIFGLILGVLLTVTKPGGILQNKVVYQVLDKLINIFRSIPFIILIAILLPLTLKIMGTRIGIEGVIVPLVFGSTPFFARQVETALASIGGGVIEAAQSMGLSPIAIIFRVYLKESIAPIARGTTITIINLIGLTAMAGYVGAGGLGDFAITYGYNVNRWDVIYVSVIVIVLLVTVVQLVGNLIAKLTTHE